jgi:hypothetical protein
MTLNHDQSGEAVTAAPEPQPSVSKEMDATSIIPSSDLIAKVHDETINESADKNKTFELRQQWHSQPRKMRIIHVGAGATGLCAAFKMERQLTEYELVCYDRNSEVGGTWLVNRYPGCACDVPAHIYTYTFEPHTKWKSYYATSPDIHDYFVGFCEKYDLRKYIKLQHTVLGAVWHEDKAQWEVEVEHNGETFTDWCDVLVNGSGLLNQWQCEC